MRQVYFFSEHILLLRACLEKKIAAIHKEPVIFLKYYMIQDQAGNEKMDFSECDCAYMIVKWSQMENVQIAYEE